MAHRHQSYIVWVNPPITLNKVFPFKNASKTNVNKQVFASCEFLENSQIFVNFSFQSLSIFAKSFILHCTKKEVFH